MALLFVDNSSKIIRILLQTRDFYTEYHVFNSINKSNSIIYYIDQLLSSNKLTSQDITKVAYINSGLSFTGLRLALSMLIAISYVNRSQIFPIDPYVSILLQHLKQNPILPSRYYAVVLPSNDHRTSLAIVEYDSNNSKVLNKYNINVNDASTIIIPDEYSLIDDITIINPLPAQITQRFLQNIKLQHQKKDITFSMVQSANFELSYISQLILNNQFATVDLNSADLLY
jgi:hypothetical protein